jgi:predicted CoA-binding protein
MNELTSDQELRQVLQEAHTIAVLGAHPDASRPAHYVPAYLHDQGCRILPVNGQHAGKELWGEPVRATLSDLGLPVDIVDVFRRAEALSAHLPEILAMKPRPKLVWLQQGIRNDEFARRLLDEGIAVVQDRCTMAEHKRLVAGPR